MKGNVVSFINMKGGVGKTTLCIGIGDYLADKKDMSVLIIDADPQFNSTQALLDYYKKDRKSESEENFYTKEVLKKNKTIYELFKPQIEVNSGYTTPKAEDLITVLYNNLHILCGDLNLVLANKSNEYTFVKRMRNFIEDNELRARYDFILIDCPPTLTIYTDSALMASDFYIIPNQIDRYSIIGIDSLQKAVKNLVREERISLKCLGIIYTMVEKDLPKKKERLKLDFESKQTVNEIEIFTTMYTLSGNIKAGASGTLPTNYQSTLEDIEAISVEFLDKINKELEENND